MGRRKKGRTDVRYDLAFKLKVLKEAREKNFSGMEVEKIYGVTNHTYYEWKKRYLEGGEAGLAVKRSGPRPGNGNGAGKSRGKWHEEVVAAKRENPCFGAGRLWHWLRRNLALPATRREVHEALKSENLLEKPSVKRKKPVWQPQSFERAKPNQLWQSDISGFNIQGGEGRGTRVYLIGFMDDHSRYMVSWGLYAGQSGKLVLEVLRRGLSRYGRPREILTDNGRQYKSWHGDTEFQKELNREGIRHITSRPHHPQTLGKIESFWGHMKKEWLARVMHGDIETMRERLAHWINYYNFQRIHSGIGNIPPAERYFAYGDAVRAEIEKRIAANERELSLAAPGDGSKVGETPLGESRVVVRKEGAEFVVRLDGREVSRTDLQPKEEGHETEETAVGTNGSDGCASQSEGGAGAGGAVGRENDLRGVPGGRTGVLAVLQTGGEDGAGHAGSGADACTAGSEPGSGGDAVVGGNGGSAAGTPAHEESAAGLAQADGGRAGESEARTASEDSGHLAGPAGDGGGNPEETGQTAAGGGRSGAEGGMSDGAESGRDARMETGADGTSGAGG
jgi:putative transposase